jgi:acyl carrier protein
MTDMHRIVLQRVIDYVRENLHHPPIIDEAERLDVLGIDSMATITILVLLEQEFGLDVGRMLDARPPKTLGELVALAVGALPVRSSHVLAPAGQLS